MNSSFLLLGRVSSLGVGIILAVVVLLAALPMIIVMTGRRNEEADDEDESGEPDREQGQDEQKDSE